MKLKHMNYSYCIEENCIRKKYRIQLITLTYLNPYGNRFSIIPKTCHVYCLIRHIECIHIHILFVPSPTSHFTYCQHNNINQLCNFCSHHMFGTNHPEIITAGKLPLPDKPAVKLAINQLSIERFWDYFMPSIYYFMVIHLPQI